MLGFVVGAISGDLFSLLLMRRERNRTVSSISTWRAAGWGFVGAAALPVLTVLGLGYISVVPIGILVAGTVKAGLLGAGVAASMITIARRAERRAQLEIAPRLVE